MDKSFHGPGHDFPRHFSETDLSLPYISNHRTALDADQKPRDDLEPSVPFSLFWKSAAVHTLGDTSRTQSGVECQVLYSSSDKRTLVLTLCFYLSPCSRHYSCHSGPATNAQMPMAVSLHADPVLCQLPVHSLSPAGIT